MNALIATASVFGFCLVAAGAAGAHLMAGDAAGGARWSSALVFGFVHVLATLAAAALPGREALRIAAGAAFLLGVLLFCGVQLAKMHTAVDGRSLLDPLTFLVPVGGAAMLAGWLLLAASAVLVRRRRE
ncbi:DUF423 domain-containing protein [bacterium]|nr:DUF423 domain-containing protein [bacterium]